MKKEYYKVTKDGFSLMETDKKNVLLLFREDEKPFYGDWQKITQTAIQYYILYAKRLHLTIPAGREMEVAISDDNTIIRLTISDMNTVKH